MYLCVVIHLIGPCLIGEVLWYSIHCTPNPIPKSYPAHRRESIEFIFIGPKVTAQTRLRMPITLLPIALHHLKKDHWLPVAESFPTMYYNICVILQLSFSAAIIPKLRCFCASYHGKTNLKFWANLNFDIGMVEMSYISVRSHKRKSITMVECTLVSLT